MCITRKTVATNLPERHEYHLVSTSAVKQPTGERVDKILAAQFRRWQPTSAYMGAERARACSSSSSTSIPAPSPMTNPSRSASNGREADLGSSLKLLNKEESESEGRREAEREMRT